MARGDGGCLNNDSDDEHGDIDEDGVFSGENLSQETRVHSTEPCTEFENRDEPALLRGVPLQGFLVGDVVSHVCVLQLAAYIPIGSRRDSNSRSLKEVITRTPEKTPWL